MQENPSNTTSINVQLSVGNELRVFQTQTPLSFHRIGNGMKHKNGKHVSIDLLTLMENMCRAEKQTINLIRQNVVWEQDPDTLKNGTTGISFIPPSFFNIKGFNAPSITKQQFQRGLRLLKNKGLATKVDTNHYMLHPLALIPTRPMKGIEIWDKHTE